MAYRTDDLIHYMKKKHGSALLQKSLLQIFSPRKQKSMRERFPSIILLRAIRQLFRRKNLNWCRLNSTNANPMVV
jgi:hypothetical protein